MVTTVKIYRYPTTCYDGAKEFSWVAGPSDVRSYPDEWLIINMLRKLQTLYNIPDDTLTIVHELWSSIEIFRDGGENTPLLAEKIQSLITQASPPRFILIPLLVGYHHPGFILDTVNKKAYYLDPYGTRSYLRYPAAEAICTLLDSQKYRICYNDRDQQGRGKDSTNCGPILTDNFSRFIELLVQNSYPAQGFNSSAEFQDALDLQASMPFKATRRMLQMWINNEIPLTEGVLVDEIMLADITLWEACFDELGIGFNNCLKIYLEKELETIPNVVAANATEDAIKEAIKKISTRQMKILSIILSDPHSIGKYLMISDEGCIELNVDKLDELPMLNLVDSSCSYTDRLSLLMRQARRPVEAQSASSSGFRSGIYVSAAGASSETSYEQIFRDLDKSFSSIGISINFSDLYQKIRRWQRNFNIPEERCDLILNSIKDECIQLKKSSPQSGDAMISLVTLIRKVEAMQTQMLDRNNPQEIFELLGIPSSERPYGK